LIGVQDRFIWFKIRIYRSNHKRPFKFEKLWLHKQNVEEVVTQSWIYRDRGSPTYHISKKLETLKEDLRSWSKDTGEYT